MGRGEVRRGAMSRVFGQLDINRGFITWICGPRSPSPGSSSGPPLDRC
jgi:hypothetical protein